MFEFRFGVFGVFRTCLGVHQLCSHVSFDWHPSANLAPLASEVLSEA